ncbi:hypothetical protein LCGC14_0297850 [marine sediment metagenome]|uniref:Uncharacterized protein n=1 Tax=marine sediment metagenome TaxID=412755 RepID=A0A0F9WCJ2_9ZZZZ
MDTCWRAALTGIATRYPGWREPAGSVRWPSVPSTAADPAGIDTRTRLRRGVNTLEVGQAQYSVRFPLRRLGIAGSG